MSAYLSGWLDRAREGRVLTGMEQLVAREAHDLKAAGSSPAPGTDGSEVVRLVEDAVSKTVA